MTRSHRQQRGDCHELRLAAGQPLRIAFDQRLESQARNRLSRASDGLRHRKTEVHRADGDLLEDGRGKTGPLRVRILEADDDMLREFVGAQAGCRRAVEAQRSLQLASNRGGREAGGDEAER